MRRISMALLSACLTIMGISVGSRDGYPADWPTQTITIVCPYAPGSSCDRLSRVVGEALSINLGVPVIVQNRVGAGGLIGASYVARSEPDGYTLLLSGAVQIVAPFVNKSPPVDTVHDFTHIAYIGSTPLAWAVNPNLDIHTVPEAIKAARDGKLTQYATSQAGSLAHVLTEQVNQSLGLKLDAVHYNDIAFADVVMGRVPMVATALPNALPLAQAGALRLIGVLTDERVPTAPNVPTFKEQGVGATAEMWQSLAGPKGLPKAITQRIAEIVAQTISKPDVKVKLVNDLDGKSMGPAELSRYFESETARLQPILAEIAPP